MAQFSDEQIVEAVRRAFREEPRLGPAFHLDRIEFEADGLLLLEGPVATLAQKKLALVRAAAVPGVTELVDRVRVASQGNVRHIRAQLAETIAGEPAFAGFELREKMTGLATGADEETDVDQVLAAGCIDIEVNDDVVILNGTVPSLVHQRLAGVIAWRIPGVRDVVNGIVVEPFEADGPDQIEEAVRAALDSNPAVNASQIRVGARGQAIRLTGLVPSGEIRDLAERDAWAVLGVNDVANEIVVRS